jgi:Skp family chaperone for outer membrane proteins
LFVIFVFSLFLASFTSALDIPLEGGGGGGTGKLSIGYVDMEKIFQLYPKTMDAKADYARQLKAKREELAKREAELNAVQTKLTVLESTLKTGAAPLGHSDVDSSTSTTNPTPSVEESAIDPNLENAEAKEPQSLVTLRKELQDKKADFEEQRKRAQDDLLAFERRQSQIILGNIYQALRDLAQEEQVTVVVDKSSILYGDATIDLTDKLQNKVRGY